MKKYIVKLIIIISTLSLFLIGCSRNEAVKPDKDSNKVVQDKKYTENIKKEKGVEEGQVYVQNGTAVGTMILKKDISDEEGKKLAEKYADELKETYKDLKINVQAVKEGKNIANIQK